MYSLYIECFMDVSQANDHD